MKRTWKIIMITIFMVVCASILSACIPPFIDGAVEVKDYFDDAVKYNVYKIDPNEEGGYATVDGASLTLAELTDDDEKNIAMLHYYSFRFSAKNDIKLQTLAFVVEVEEPDELNFQLKYDTLTFNQSIILNTNKKGTLQFADLNLDIASSNELIITLINPLLVSSKYRIDTTIFVVGK